MSVPRRVLTCSCAGALAAIVACLDWSSPSRWPAPEIGAMHVAANAENAISAVVIAYVTGADSVRVLYRATPGSESESATPVVLASDPVVLPVLALMPDQEYSLRVEAFGAGGVTRGAPVSFTTGALPLDLPAYRASGDDPSPGYVVFAAGKYGVIIDNSGRVVWYRYFPNGLWLNFMPQSNGRYVARLVTPDQFDRESWAEIDALGQMTRTFGCAQGLQARFHDLIVKPNGDYWILCDETRTMDLSQHGGHANAEVTGTAIQHVTAAGELRFSWSPFDHFSITDVDSVTRSAATVNWTHGNSLDFDATGNLLVSFRNLHEITNIDVRTGEVVWRLGGIGNQFALAGDDNAFAGQHGVRSMTDGRIVLLDNIGDSAASRVEEWLVDANGRVASIVGSRASTPAVRTLIGGSVQLLSGGRTLVSFGTEGRVEEYDSAGRVVWRIEGHPGYVFRAQRIQSLYRPGSR